ncbi:hypothetical protein EI94DRAFT_1754276 [Lactarius quietus]|nr:hypothetical protein EI94DRAFT_1754276 [Lactarius quietus]
MWSCAASLPRMCCAVSLTRLSRGRAAIAASRTCLLVSVNQSLYMMESDKRGGQIIIAVKRVKSLTSAKILGQARISMRIFPPRMATFCRGHVSWGPWECRPTYGRNFSTSPPFRETDFESPAGAEISK